MAGRRLRNPVIFVCDIQEKFRPAIWEFPNVLSTAEKMLKASKILDIPVYATTQNREKLGPTCSELMPYLQGSSTSSSDTPSQAVEHVDKTAFSMWVPQIAEHFPAPSVGTAKGDAHDIAIVGIETHVCVTQTALDLLNHGHRVYIIADGVSSCNPHEIPVALQRLRSQGAVVTTSESWLFEVMGDARIPEFRQISSLVKEWKEKTRSSLEALCPVTTTGTAPRL